MPGYASEHIQAEIPLLLRRKTFFQLQQQDERSFVEHLKAAAGEADIQGMNLEDALCLVTISGLKDSRFRVNLKTRLLTLLS